MYNISSSLYRGSALYINPPYKWVTLVARLKDEERLPKVDVRKQQSADCFVSLQRKLNREEYVCAHTQTQISCLQFLLVSAHNGGQIKVESFH